MPPEAIANGVAAAALAKAAFAGKAKAQSAGLETGSGTGPQGALPPSGPAPVATRRWQTASIRIEPLMGFWKAVPASPRRQGPRGWLKTKAKAKAAAAGRAQARAKGLGRSRGAGSKGTLLPPGPPPVTTR